MAVAAQAALLDELMGKSRNVALSEAKTPHWSDEDMCKHFLAGLCPNELFNNTKDDLGPCEKVHDDALLKQYQKSKRCGEMHYEEELCAYLRELISTVESRIRRGETRLKKNGNLVHSFYNCEREESLEEITIKIEEALCKAEKLGTEGEVQQSCVWFDVAENLKNDKTRIERNIEIYNQQAKELEICQTCGAFQVKGDAQQRIEEHLQGKMHLGYAQIREYLAARAAEKERIKRSKSGDKEASRKKDSSRLKDRLKREDRSQSKDTEKIKKEEKSDNKDREKSRKYEAPRSRDKDSVKKENKDKSKEKESPRRRESGQSRNKDRSRREDDPGTARRRDSHIEEWHYGRRERTPDRRARSRRRSRSPRQSRGHR